MSLKEAASSGNRLKTLEALRDFLAENLDDCESKRDIASMTTRLESVLEQIEKLEGPKSAGDGIDEIAQRRAARRASAASRPVRASGKV